MRRLHLFEFTDIAWWPQVFRRLLTDFLTTMINLTQPFSVKLDLLAKVIEQSGQSKIVDLCSGAGGPWSHLAEQLREASGNDVEIILTDKYPDSVAAETIADLPGVTYCEQSIDAMDVPEQFTGVRTLFDGFHHFPPDKAQKILQNAVDGGQAIIIFEILQRNVWNIIGALTAPLAVFCLGFVTRPVTFTRVLFTYLIPIAPIVITWDSIVSQARCYSPDELLNMSENVRGAPYQWEAGAYRHRGVPVTYLVGYPKST